MEYNGAALGIMSCVFVLTIIMCIMSIINALYMPTYNASKQHNCSCSDMIPDPPHKVIQPSVYTAAKESWMPTNAYSSPGVKDGSDVPRYNVKDATRYQPSHSPPADGVMKVNKPIGFSDMEYA